jgi:hypothetical protein
LGLSEEQRSNMLNPGGLKRRRVELLWALYQLPADDVTLQMAALSVGREAGGRVFEFDKRALIGEGAIEEIDMSGWEQPPELYKVTAEGEKILRDWGYRVGS